MQTLDILLQILFWGCLYGIIHTYLLFPAVMKWFSLKEQTFPELKSRFRVAILMAAYNEEKILQQKMQSMLESNYPLELIEIWVGSDKSTDQTDAILQHFHDLFPQTVHFIRFNERTGKPQIINNLQKKLQNIDILILTDADTLFNKKTIPELLRPFEDNSIGGVQAYFISHANEANDVQKQEVAYNNRELMIKQGESRLGCVIGAYGACYAIRNELYVPVPKNFIVDDFFIFLHILQRGYKTVLNEKATCNMEISGDSNIEFQRKIRIGSGNYQNLFYFKSFWFPFFPKRNLIYWSHKVLRWLTPFFLLFLLLMNLFMFNKHAIYQYTAFSQLAVYWMAFMDILLKNWKINLKLLRFIKHFFMMNLALFKGFFKFISKIQQGSWDTKN